MKIIRSCVITAIAVLAGGSAYAAEAGKANVTRVYTDTVEPAQQQAYETAVKSYNKCLGEHGLKYAWLAWGHETGNTYMYSFAAGPYTWADFDTMHDAGKACDDTWHAQANPHLKGETSAFLIEMPELSRMPSDKNAKPALISVTFFTLKGDRGAEDAFTEGLKKIVAAADKTKWTGHYTVYKTKGADKDAPDYLILSPYKNWAAYGAGADPGVWKMLENSDGKENAEAVHKSINDAIQDVSSHVDNYSEDLTYSPSKK